LLKLPLERTIHRCNGRDSVATVSAPFQRYKREKSLEYIEHLPLQRRTLPLQRRTSRYMHVGKLRCNAGHSVATVVAPLQRSRQSLDYKSKLSPFSKQVFHYSFCNILLRAKVKAIFPLCVLVTILKILVRLVIVVSYFVSPIR
jgi:hypothetical protein